MPLTLEVLRTRIAELRERIAGHAYGRDNGGCYMCFNSDARIPADVQLHTQLGLEVRHARAKPTLYPKCV